MARPSTGRRRWSTPCWPPVTGPDGPDGPVAAVSGMFVQTFGGGAWALALPVGTEFPYGARARRLEGPFLARYLAAGGWSGGSAAFGPPLAAERTKVEM